MSVAGPSDFAVALIAGGRSRRLGQDKAFVELGNPPRALWRWQLDKLRSLQPAQILISSRPDQDFGDLPDVKLVRDKVADQGPLAGLVSCLETSSQAHLLVLAVDMPRISRAFLQDLLSHREPGRGIAPQIEGRWEGLVALYPREILEEAARRLEAEDRSLQGLLRHGLTVGQMQVRAVDEDERPSFASLNTPEDLRDLDGVSLELG